MECAECPRCAAMRERQRKRIQERLQNEPGFRAKIAEKSREAYRKDPERRRAAAYKRAIDKGVIPGSAVLMERYGIVRPPAQPAASAPEAQG